MALNRKYAPEVFKASSTYGSNFVTKNANVQFAENAMEEPSLLASGGNISAFIVQHKGPNPIAKAITKVTRLTTGNHPRPSMTAGSIEPWQLFSTDLMNSFKRSCHWWGPKSQIWRKEKIILLYDLYTILLKEICAIHFDPGKVGYHFHRRFGFHPNRNKFQEQPGVKPWKHWTIWAKSCGQICRQWRPLRQFHSIEPRQPKMQPQLLNGTLVIRFAQPFEMILEPVCCKN